MKYDFIVIGTGISGLSFALKASKIGRVLILTKDQSEDSASYLAQGGIASVLGEGMASSGDNEEIHIKDTLKVGGGLCKRSIAKKFIHDGKRCIEELSDYGVHFDKRGNRFSLGMEAGHSQRRVVHHKDRTGKAIISELLKHIEENKRIDVWENHSAVELIAKNRRMRKRIFGTFVLNHSSNKIFPLYAPYVVLATGGSGKTYLYTSNPDTATGDGISLAWRAGAEIINMEFIQFHPTCFFQSSMKNQEHKRLLISETLRGEGAVLINQRGENFMKSYDFRGSLAPRDVVARSIFQEMLSSQVPCVYLDCSSILEERMKERFSHIYEILLSEGINCAKEPIPVVPAAHYQCGGVKTNVYGESNIEGLYAIGEVACNGLHGANRLASNSLLESYLSASYAAGRIKAKGKPSFHYENGEETLIIQEDKNTLDLDSKWNLIRKTMWENAAILREEKKLKKALSTLSKIEQEISLTQKDFGMSKKSLEVFNLATTAKIIVQSALKRKESRGVHFRKDFPSKSWFYSRNIKLRKGRSF